MKCVYCDKYIARRNCLFNEAVIMLPGGLEKILPIVACQDCSNENGVGWKNGKTDTI